MSAAEPVIIKVCRANRTVDVRCGILPVPAQITVDVSGLGCPAEMCVVNPHTGECLASIRIPGDGRYRWNTYTRESLRFMVGNSVDAFVRAWIQIGTESDLYATGTVSLVRNTIGESDKPEPEPITRYLTENDYADLKQQIADEAAARARTDAAHADALSRKMPAVTMDTEPHAGSAVPVTSDGIAAALSGRLPATLTGTDVWQIAGALKLAHIMGLLSLTSATGAMITLPNTSGKMATLADIESTAKGCMPKQAAETALAEINEDIGTLAADVAGLRNRMTAAEKDLARIPAAVTVPAAVRQRLTGFNPDTATTGDMFTAVADIAGIVLQMIGGK